MSSQDGTIPRKCQTDSLIQAVHRVGSKHTRATSASRTSMTFNFSYVFIAHRRIGRLNHGINQIQMLSAPLSGLHRSTRHKHSRNIQTHGRHQHPRSNLVTIGDTHHRICLVCIHHIFYAVGDDVARRQRIQHPVMPHRDSVVDGNGIKFCRKASQLLNFCLDLLTDFMQVSMPWYKLCKRIHDGDNRFSHHFLFHSIGHPQCSGTCHAATFRAHRTT